MKKLLFLLLLCFVSGCMNSVERAEKKGKKTVNAKNLIGTQAPEFTMADETGASRTLAEFRGKKIVLYFYPKDDTPGCTAQACSLRDGFTVLQNAGIQVLGVSYDSPKSHIKFKEKYHLPFPLLSDSSKKVARAYGVSGFLGLVPQRVTFLIDEKGIVVAVLDKVDVGHHADQVLEAFGLQEK